ncbi:MAG: YfiR family protein [Gammaproteobacteria bacterium]|nr:YfiR family protein [Gammaproteobacteria bacterium]
MLCFSSLLLPAMAAGPVSAEYKLKVALVYKLIRFVEWPQAASGKPPERFGICVLGRDDFGTALDALEERKVGGVPIVIQRFSQSKNIEMQCQLVFISDSKRAFLKPILHAFGERPILTIGDSAKFAEKGGMIQLTSGEKRIGFKINLQRARASSLKIAAPLLQLATIVGSKDVGSKKVPVKDKGDTQ